MGIALKRDAETKPIDVESQVLKKRFLKTLNSIFQKNPRVATYLKALDGKSSESYSHSVNVSFHVFEMITKDREFVYTKNEIERWTEAALVHDTGKLTTSNAILHSHEEMRGGKTNEETKNANFSKMMRHSIDGYDLGKQEFRFGKESIAAIIGHHVSSEYLEDGPRNGFKGASKSRKEWSIEFEEGYIEELLTSNLGWMTSKDIHALQTISFVDDIEALRSKNRSYQLQHHWDKDDFEVKDELGRKHGKSVEGIINENIKIHRRLSSSFDGVVFKKSFQRRFDSLQEMNVEKDVRNLVGEYSKGIEVRVFMDKIKDIDRDPELGKLFFEGFILEEEPYKVGDIYSEVKKEENIMKIEVESIESLLKEYDIDTSKQLHSSSELFGIIDEAVTKKVQKPDDFVEGIEDLDF